MSVIPSGVWYDVTVDDFYSAAPAPGYAPGSTPCYASMGRVFYNEWKTHAMAFPQSAEACGFAAPKLRPEPICACLPLLCSASADGRARGRVSAISDVRCKATMRVEYGGSTPTTEALSAAMTPGKTFELGKGEMFMRAAGPSAPDLLEAAAHHMRERAATFDKPEGERSIAKVVEVFNALEGTELTEVQGWTFMLILKLVRDNQREGGHRDSVEDSVSYSALRGEARLRRG